MNNNSKNYNHIILVVNKVIKISFNSKNKIFRKKIQIKKPKENIINNSNNNQSTFFINLLNNLFLNLLKKKKIKIKLLLK